jgi:hypothetical protein
MNESFADVPTPALEREAARLERRLIKGASSALDIERFCLIQMELGARLERESVLDPRD